MELRFDYVIAGAITRGGSVFAQTHADARAQVQAMLRAGERIYSLTIHNR